MTSSRIVSVTARWITLGKVMQGDSGFGEIYIAVHHFKGTAVTKPYTMMQTGLKKLARLARKQFAF